ncbi:MAG: hypothetical protein WC082_13610 [Victivallales bacterium]
MAGNKKSCMVLAIVLGVIPLLALGGVGAFVYFTYIKQRTLIVSEIERLPAFDAEKASSEIAAEFNFQLPAREPVLSEEAINKRIKTGILKKTAEKFSLKKRSADLIAIMQKYTPAKVGKEVSFQLMPRADQGSGDMIKGIYKGVSSSPSGKLVSVGNKKYLFSSIPEEYKYLFDEGIAKVLQDEKIKEYRSKFESDKKEFMASLAENYEKKLFVSAGYSKNKDEKWLPNSAILKEELEKHKAAFKKERSKNMDELLKKHKVFGIYQIEKSEIVKRLSSEDTASASDAGEKQVAPVKTEASAKEKSDKK